MEEFEFCRLCLATKVRKFDFATIPDLFEVYEKLVSTNMIWEEKKYYACYECFCILRKFLDFQNKCQHSENILSKMRLCNKNMIELKTIEDVHCTDSKLFSPFCLSETFVLSIDSFKQEAMIDLTENEVTCDGNNETNDSIFNLQNDYDHDVSHNEDSCNETKSTPIKLENDCNEISTKLENNIIFVALPKPKIEKSSKNTKVKRSKKRIKSEKMNVFDGYAKVEELSLEAAIKEVQSRKETDSYKSSKYKCELCFHGYGVQTAFDNHMRKHSPKSGEHVCKACHIRCTSASRLFKHYTICHRRKFSCMMCPYVCFGQYQAKVHINTHKGKIYSCNKCQREFKSSRLLTRHQQCVHMCGARWHSCGACGDSFTSAKGLTVHAALHKPTDIKILGPHCDVCDIQFATELAWKRHLVSSSKHEVSNGCIKCGESFSDAESLKLHNRETHPENEDFFELRKLPYYTCEICNVVLGRIGFNQHMRTKHPETIEAKQKKNSDTEPKTCPVCNKTLPYKSYKRHMRTLHPDNPEAGKQSKQNPYFVCETCGKAFTNIPHLKCHQRSHSDDRDFKCDDCGKDYKNKTMLMCHRRDVHLRKELLKCDLCPRQFQYKNSLTRHLKCVHLGVKPFKCSMCDRAYLNPSDLKSHVKHTHLNVPWPKRTLNAVKRERRPRTNT